MLKIFQAKRQTISENIRIKHFKSSNNLLIEDVVSYSYRKNLTSQIVPGKLQIKSCKKDNIRSQNFPN